MMNFLEVTPGTIDTALAGVKTVFTFGIGLIKDGAQAVLDTPVLLIPVGIGLAVGGVFTVVRAIKR